MTMTTPAIQPKAFRVAITLEKAESRMDSVLLNALREQEDNLDMKLISRAALKVLFNDKKVLIKGQRAKSSSALAKGTTYVDILE